MTLVFIWFSLPLRYAALTLGLDLQLRVAHKLTPQLRREVVVGSTNIGDPHQFIRVSVASIMSCRVRTVDFTTCMCSIVDISVRCPHTYVVSAAENAELEQIRDR